MQRIKLINPSFEEIQELRVAVRHAKHYFNILRNQLFDHCKYDVARHKYNALYGLYKSNKMSKSLGLARSFFEDCNLPIPDSLYGINENRRRFYIVELLILLGEYLGVE